MEPVIDHIEITVRDMTAAVHFYDQLLPLLGYDLTNRTVTIIESHEKHVVTYEHPRLSFSITSPRAAFATHEINRRKPGALHHLAFSARSRAEVDRVYVAVQAIGATIVSPPKEYPEYTPAGYYALYFKDPDGIKYEVVCHDHAATGRIILLHGTSSAGKSALSKAIQGALDQPFMHFSSDHLSPGLPDRRDSDGAFQWWGDRRSRFFDGFHHSIAALAAAGNDLIVEHVIEFAGWRRALQQILEPFDVFLVGVHCAPDEIDRRESVRGDRWIGEGRSHLEDGIHTFGAYDCEVDTTGREPADVAIDVVQQWRRRTRSVLFAERPQTCDR